MSSSPFLGALAARVVMVVCVCVVVVMVYECEST